MNYRHIALALGILIFSTSLSYADLIHHYKFDSGITDSAGSANGTLQGGATVADGVLKLDGLDDYVYFNSFLVPGSGNYSVALFAKWTGGQMRLAEMISQGESQQPGFFIGLQDSTGQIRATDSWITTGVIMPNDNQFHHLALTVDSTAGKSFFYLDGGLKATLNMAITTSLSNSFTRFGRQFGNNAEFFKGELDDVRIYNQTLSAGDVANLAGVPEPGSALVAGVMGLCCFSRFRRRR